MLYYEKGRPMALVPFSNKISVIVNIPCSSPLPLMLQQTDGQLKKLKKVIV